MIIAEFATANPRLILGSNSSSWMLRRLLQLKYLELLTQMTSLTTPTFSLAVVVETSLAWLDQYTFRSCLFSVSLSVILPQQLLPWPLPTCLKYSGWPHWFFWDLISLLWNPSNPNVSQPHRKELMRRYQELKAQRDRERRDPEDINRDATLDRLMVQDDIDTDSAPVLIDRDTGRRPQRWGRRLVIS